MDKKSLSESAQACNPELLRKGLAKVKWDKNEKNLQSKRLYQTLSYLYYLIVEPDGLKLQIIQLNEKLEEEIVPIIYQQSSASSLFDIEIANEMLLLKEKYFSISGFLVTKKLSIGRIERAEIILAMFQSDELIQADFHTFNNLKYIGALTPPNYSRYPKQYDQKFHIFKLGQELPIFTISINLWTQQQFTSFSFSAPGDENESIIYFCNLKGAIYQLILPLPELFVNHSTFNYIHDRFAKGPIYDTINLTQKKIKDRIVCNFEPLEKWEHHVEFSEIQISQYSDLIEDYQCYLISKCQQNFLYTVHIKDANSILILAYLWDEEEKVYQNFYSDQISTYKQNPTTDLKTLQFSLPERIPFKQLSQRQKFYMNPLKNTEIISYQNNLILIDYNNLTNQSKENAVSIYCSSFKVKQTELDFKQVAIISFKDERNIVIIQGDLWRILDKNQIQKIKNQKLKQQIFDEKFANNQTSSLYWEDFNKLDLMSQQLKIVRDQLMKIQEAEVIEDVESETENIEIGCNFDDYNDVKESGKFDNAPTFDFEDVVENRNSKFEPKFKGKLEENSSKLKPNQSQEQLSVQQSKKSKEQQPQQQADKLRNQTLWQKKQQQLSEQQQSLKQKHEQLSAQLQNKLQVQQKSEYQTEQLSEGEYQQEEKVLLYQQPEQLPDQYSDYQPEQLSCLLPDQPKLQKEQQQEKQEKQKQQLMKQPQQFYKQQSLKPKQFYEQKTEQLQLEQIPDQSEQWQQQLEEQLEQLQDEQLSEQFPEQLFDQEDSQEDLVEDQQDEYTEEQLESSLKEDSQEIQKSTNPFFDECESFLELFILNQLNPIASRIKQNHFNLISNIDYCIRNNWIVKLQQRKVQMVSKIQQRSKEIKERFIKHNFENDQTLYLLSQSAQELDSKWEELRHLNQEFFKLKYQREKEIVSLVKEGYNIQDAHQQLTESLDYIKDQLCQRLYQ